MHVPRSLILRTAVPGALAGVLSMLVLAARGRSDAGSALAPLNAPSQWIHGRKALLQTRASWRYTVPAVAIHQASTFMWAFLFDRFLRKPDTSETPISLISKVAAFTGVAALVDLKLVPDRFSPGFQHHLSKKSLVWTYGAFAGGLALGALVLMAKDRGTASIR